MKRILNKKSVAVLVSVALLLCLAVGGSLALLIDQTGPIKNIFNPSKVSTDVVENLSGGVKSNVRIQNTSDISAYIRADVVVTWKNAEGHIYGTAPVAGADYQIAYGNGWTQKDGFFYWPTPVDADDKDSTTTVDMTGVLIQSCSYIDNAPEGYFLNVEIIASGIQAEGIAKGSHPWGI